MAGERAYISFSIDTDTGDADQSIDALLEGQKWDTSSSTLITYSFIDEASDIAYDTGGLTFANGFNSAQMAAVELAFSMLAELALVTFDEIGDDPGEDNADGTLRFGDFEGLYTAYGFYPYSDEAAGDMAFKDGQYETPDIGSYAFAAGILHEIGHAMGLKHAHEEANGTGLIEDRHDSHEYTVMTYHSYVGQPDSIRFLANAPGHNPQSFMMLDIAALQRMYGANFETNSGNTTYTFSTKTGEMFVNGTGQGTPGENIVLRTIWDGGGKDTYDLSNYDTAMLIDLEPGFHSTFDYHGTAQRAELNDGYADDGTFVGDTAVVFAQANLYNALQFEGDKRSLIENAIGGSGDDGIYGNSANNMLKGGGGKDWLFGFGGADDLIGGGKRDKLSGSGGNDDLNGGGGRDRLKGGNGRDDFFGGKGNDKHTGGKGADTFYFDTTVRSGKDKITDFEDGKDMIEIAGGGKVTWSRDGDDTVVVWNKGQVTLLGVDEGLINNDDFNFV